MEHSSNTHHNQPVGSKGLSYLALDGRPHHREGPAPAELVGPRLAGPVWLVYMPSLYDGPYSSNVLFTTNMVDYDENKIA
jgi:hypothetical protein